MFSLHAFTASMATSTALGNVAAASDPVAAVSGNFMYVPALSNLIGAYAIGATLGRAQLQSPSLVAFAPYDISPVDAGTDPATPLPITLHPASPLKLVTDEPLQALVTNTVNETDTVFVFLSDGALAPVSGAILRVRATFTSSATGYSWQNSTITLTNQLAEGTYNLVGARAEGVHALAARFVFPGSNNAYRPGFICTGTKAKIEPREFRNGELGVWGTFSNRVLPTVDCMTDGNSETVTLILDLIKTA